MATKGYDGRPAGLAVCRHQHVRADELAQTWSTATRFTLTMRLREADTLAAADALLTQWRDHLADLQEKEETREDDTSAVVTWPSRDVTGIRALTKHGLQPISVIAVRPAGRPTPKHQSAGRPTPKHQSAGRPTPKHDGPSDLVIRQAISADQDSVTELELGVIHYDAHFGAAFPRPATPKLVHEATRKNLEQRPDWTWLAVYRGRPVGLAVVEPPEEAAWIAGLTRPGRTAYLASMFLSPEERGTGTGAKLMTHVHDALDARGIDMTLLHYAQLNPLSGPFWHRMGYRPLWASWAALPALTLR
ncbi:MAG: GNAT family N-acetyltransferase [Streptosporangiaceae bacterium]